MVGHADDIVFAVVHRDQHPGGAALAHCRGHGGGDLPQQRICNDDTDGPHDDIRIAAVHHHGILTGGGALRPGLVHGLRGDTVGAHGHQPDVRALGTEGSHQLAPQSPALSVNDKHVHAVPQKSTSSNRSSARM